ncbi:MAG: cobalamin biosynthesis protein CbiX [Paenibacillaceae bacterium]|nr:cobalamin biosynthesis protein CbiX [Paenibacillaceae bacterium]
MPRYGVLTISHGSRSKEWVELVDGAVDGMREPDGVPVYSSFLELVDGRLIQDGIDALEGQGVTDLLVIPLFLSSGSTHLDEIGYALGVTASPKLETDLLPFRRRARVHWGAPIDAFPTIARIVCEHIRDLSVDPANEAVLIVGHGSDKPGFRERWRDGLDRLAEQVRELGGYAAAEGAMLLPDEAPGVLARWRAEWPERAVIVAPFFLSGGYFTQQVVPRRLFGYEYRYNGRALLPHPLLSRWMEESVALMLEAAKAAER